MTPTLRVGPERFPANRVIVVCASSARASLAALALKDMGYEDVAVLDGWLKAWTDASLPTASTVLGDLSALS